MTAGEIQQIILSNMAAMRAEISDLRSEAHDDINRVYAKIDTVQHTLSESLVSIAELRVRSSIWGAMAGAVGGSLTAVGAAIWFMLR